jgi:hypothetical protein
VIPPGAALVQEPGVLGTDTATQRVVLNERFEYLGLDPVATHVFALLDRPRTLDDLVARLVEDYDIDEERCRSDVAPFLEQLLAHKLIRLA